MQRNKILLLTVGKQQQQGHETPGIGENSFSERVEKLARGSDGVPIPGRVQKLSGSGTCGGAGVP